MEGEGDKLNDDNADRQYDSGGEDEDIETADPQILEWFKKMASLYLPRFAEEMWELEHDLAATELLKNPAKSHLLGFFDEENRFHLDSAITNGTEMIAQNGRILYFIFAGQKEIPVTVDEIGDVIQCGALRGTALDSLLRSMSKVFVPIVLSNKTWPDSIKKEFSGQMNKFMATLTETAYQVKGSTVLYIPNEDISDTEGAARDKDLVQRLESTLIHWTRQIKEVVNNQESGVQGRDAEDAGPLAEIEFWRSRTVDLSGIREQLKQEGIAQVLNVLDLAKSSYLQPFQKLSAEIRQKSSEAQDNLRFLSTIQNPCEQLSNAKPREIAHLLPGLLNCIRMIWNISSHYNTAERVTGLLRKVSNEIIKRCCDQIRLEEIFEGNVEASVRDLDESILCGVAWKDIYRRTVALTAKSGKRWDFDENNIFAHIDAFVQRCRDLLEVCEGQMQFARRGADGTKGPLPSFGGTRGPEICKTLLEIEAAFEKQISVLKHLNYQILDVKATHWHDDYNSFKGGLKDLEVMFQNVINSAFETVSEVEQGVELLEGFFTLAKREMIKRTVDKKASDVFTMFNNELNQTKKEFDQQRKSPPLHPFHPPTAGAALWAKGMKDRISKQWKMLEDAHYLIENREKADARSTFHSTNLALNDYIAKLYSDWIVSVESNLQKKMMNFLMVRTEDETPEGPRNDKVFEKSERGLLEHNFDKSLLRLFNEAHYWVVMRYEVPYAAMEIMQAQDKCRMHVENVLLIVRDYNNIITMMNKDERRLFHERLFALDKKINPGIHKLTYSSRDAIAVFVRECRRYCHDVYSMVSEFQSNKEHITKCCRTLADTLLINIQKKRVYEDSHFVELQERHRREQKEKLVNLFNDILETIRRSGTFFKNDSDEIQRQWAAYVMQVDKMIEDSLRTTVKKSLQDLARSINGDSRTDVHPMFKVNVILVNSQVAFKPAMSNLSEIIEDAVRELVGSVRVVPRLLDSIKKDENGGESNSSHLFDTIAEDDEILKIVSQVREGMKSAAERLEKYIVNWDKYKHIWDLDKADAFIRRYSKTKRELPAFESDINRYRDIKNQIQNEETITNVSFIRVDCGILKQTLMHNCNAWQNKFTDLLNNLAHNELKGILDLFSSNSRKLLKKPVNLDQLGQSLDLLSRLKADKEKIQARFEPLEDQYHLLERFDVSVDEEQLNLLATVEPEWIKFQKVLVDAERQLDSSKTSFKQELERSLDSFVKQVTDLREEFMMKGPFEAEVGRDKANEIIKEYKDKVASNVKKEEQLKAGLDIFGISSPQYRDTRQTEKDIENLEGVWGLSEEWDASWEAWKTGKFGDLDVSKMEEDAMKYVKRLGRLGRDIKDWKVWQSLKDKVDQFRKTMPLIQDLRNKAMRDRHWSQLQEEIGKTFDPHGDTFTLEKVMSLGLDQYEDIIGTISNAANKELSIEVALREIEEGWNVLDIEYMPYKDQGHHIVKGTDEIFQTLEDNQVTLSTMKSSRYYLAFEEEVNYWEKNLSHVSEVVEMLLQDQRQWMYLENIFAGSEDIRKQLPQESILFDKVNETWRVIMDRVVSDPNCLRASNSDNMLETLHDMDATLEKIQKSLDQYLETKRQKFPRFYFLSNDDLLEILGQARDPMAVQGHLRKCFEAIKSLEMVKQTNSRVKGIEALGMHSPEAEYVPFHDRVLCDGPVEGWLLKVEHTMRATLRKMLSQCVNSMRQTKREKWIKEWQGQLLITAGQISWTNDCVKALNEVEKGSKTAMRQLKKKQVTYLNKLSDMVRGQLTHLERIKLNALITIEVHARDVIERMIKEGASSIYDFVWLQQLRFIWDLTVDDCLVRQTNTCTHYGYEYLGNSGRLVITPLTDRAYMTLTTALHLRRGGNPLGPAGTGKTETVKDLGKAIAKYVIVFNCSDGLDYKSMGRMFSGLAQTGCWSCFDEFNRIDVEVLSVVAQQILSILNAIGEGLTSFVFEGTRIKLDHGCGIFVTMNPGYAGRSELPDNLKALLRPIAMMVPDSALIAEIMLFSEGFTTSKMLAKKLVTLYQLSIQQLSKQDHYDFGLRNIKSVLVYAGALKRNEGDLNEEMILFRALRDMNMPKFLSEDAKLFGALLGDLFPGIEPPPVDYGHLLKAIHSELRENPKIPLQLHQGIIKKTIEVYEAKSTRHGNMLVGNTGVGKSTAWNVLSRALTRLKKENIEGYQSVRTHVVNPKAVTLGELYGEYNLNTNEWTDGILSSIMRTVCADEKPDEKWIVFDGPVDTLWIESMNTVLDDNKMLTLISGERIVMPRQVSLLFEVQDLSVASPATVSRAGMVYLDALDFSYHSVVDSWLETKQESQADLIPHLKMCFEKYITRILTFKKKECKEIVPVGDIAGVQSLCRLFDSFATVDNGIVPGEDNLPRMVEMWFVFSAIWSLGGAVDETGRKRIDMCVREIDPQFPSKDTVYEYWVDSKSRTWKHWDEKVPASWKPAADMPFHKILVPTVDTLRNTFVCSSLIKSKAHLLVVGNTGTGKTFLLQQIMSNLGDGTVPGFINFSSQTSSGRVQSILEGRLEKRTKDVFGPPAGKSMVTFIDDLNMPAKDLFGSQPPLELLKLWCDYGFWYDRQKQTRKIIRDMQLLAAMGPPGGGRQEISPRFQSRFNVVNFTFPSEATVNRIFGTMLNAKLIEFEEEIKPLADPITKASLEVYTTITEQLLPTPSKSHYVFNLRDLGKVFQGLLQAHRNFYDTKESMLRLWLHECHRVFFDRLNDDADRKWFRNLMMDKLNNSFDIGWKSLFPSGELNPFADFMREGTMDDPPYEEISDMVQLKSYMENKLEDYNLEGTSLPMDLVLFRDAIDHVCKIHRILKQPRGNALLVGVGGSGRQSLTRLAAFIAEYEVFGIEITKNYRNQEFHDDLRKLYELTGVEKKPTVFLFNDTQIVLESFLEDISGILGSGEVPNLYTNDEMGPIREALRAEAKAEGIIDTNDNLNNFFIDRVRENLHIVLCMSPVGEAFRERLRMYPALVNCTTIDWFLDWPVDALKEVASKFLDEVDLTSEEMKSNVSEVFAIEHSSVVEYSQKMVAELKRHNYVTPTNYLELVKGYRSLLAEKRHQFGEAAAKLRNGLDKLEEAKQQVEEMSVELEEKKVIVAKSQKECEELLVVIVQERRVVDEQQKSVNAESEKIGKEEVECKAIAGAAQADLDLALPALEAATKALDALTKKDVSEVKAYAKPPLLVEMVMCSVMVLQKKEASWAEAKRALGDANFLSGLVHFDKDHISDSTLSKIAKFTKNPEFQPDVIRKVSNAAAGLCLWVRAMEVYGKIAKDVAPKRAKLKDAMSNLESKRSLLKAAQDKLAEVSAKVEALKEKYDNSVNTKETLRKESEELEIKLARAEKLVDGLSGERVRWESTIELYEEDIKNLIGDCLLAAAFLSYMGPFSSEYRSDLVNGVWFNKVKELNIPTTPGFSFANFLAKPTDVREWNIQGLPADSFSTENGVLVTKGQRWPLLIDPQAQGNKWIKNMEANNNLKIVDLKMSDYLRTMENAIQFGSPVLLQDVLEELDPALEPVLTKAITKQGSRMLMKLGDKEIEYNPDFKLYVTTKLSNPHYPPEISTKTTIVNCAVKEQGLEEQLLGIVVREERPDLEEQKNELVIRVAAGKKTLVELEDEILRLLSTATGSLLDDEQLVNTLNSSKTTSEEIKQQLVVSEQTEKKIDAAREGYRPSAFRASIIYFVLNDLSRVDPMYQWSLDSYIEPFKVSIDKSPKSDDLKQRIQSLNDYHTYAIYRSICRGLFEKHKLLFSFLICTKIQQGDKNLNMEDYNFFLRGGIVLDKDSQPPNPDRTWILDTAWDHLTELDKVSSFRNIVSSFESNSSEWKEWYRSPEPETTSLPGEWHQKCDDLQKLILLRCLRPDRVIFASTAYISQHLDKKYVEPPILDLNQVYHDSNNFTPLIFVLSPGVDPVTNLQQLAEHMGMVDNFKSLALGQGQSPIATKMIEAGIEEGHWVFLANCHLSISWMPQLEKIIEALPTRKIHKNFRLWLSSVPHPKFPISILQTGLKMTTEPPKGLKANLLRLYSLMSEKQFHKCAKQSKYKKLLFALCYFHSCLLERRKFRNLGFNIPYDFNDADFNISENIVSLYLDEYEDTPWDALRYLVAEASYGGRVTDDWDRRLINVYITSFFCDEAVTVPTFKLSPLSAYYIPDDGSINHYKEYISSLPPHDHPEAFGQDMNADVASQIEDSNAMLETIVSLQPALVSASGETPESRVMDLSTELLEQLPECFDIQDIVKQKSDDPSPMHVVLFQEMERYNILLNIIRKSLVSLQKGIKGLVVISSELDAIFSSLLDNRVPAAWLKAYPSLKPLASWTRDLLDRLTLFQEWSDSGYPRVYWLGGFTFPTGFLTAVLQTSARKNNIAIDTLAWEFPIINADEKDLTQNPKEGVYVKGLYLEGASWNSENGELCEPLPMELVSNMPIIHFKPMESKKKANKGVYSCPCYLYPVRTGTRERPSYMLTVDLKTSQYEPSFWTKRGAALLLSLSY